jgi:hypothetical protein
LGGISTMSFTGRLKNPAAFWLASFNCTRWVHSQNNYRIKQQRKPEWVTKEIIRLKAFMSHEECRKVADTFNRLYAEKRNTSIGKTFVYYTIQKHRYEIMMLRRKIKNKRPPPLPKNLIWTMDLTQTRDQQKSLHDAV